MTLRRGARAPVTAVDGSVRRGSPTSGLGGDFWWLWTASAASNLGDGVRLTALPLLAAAITTNPTAVAGVMAATLPSVAAVRSRRRSDHRPR